MTASGRQVLAINSGSSSLKAAVYALGPAEARVAVGGCERPSGRRRGCALLLSGEEVPRCVAAAIGGLDLPVFTAGIGECAAPVRERICAGLEFLGIELDGERNRQHAAVISSERSRVTVRVIRTNEELMVARYASQIAPGEGRPA